MPWGYVAGAVAGAVANKALAPSGNGGTSSGNSPPVYIPQDQAGADQNFLDNKGQYQSTLNQQQSAIGPYNQQLLTGQFNNPNNFYAQQAADWTRQDFYNNANNANDLQAGNYAYAGQQMANANQANQLYQSGLGNVQNSSNALYGMADKSNQNYQGLMDYQKGQLGNIQKSQTNLYGSGDSVLNTAFDPQSALYNRTQQQLTEQNRVAQAARGIQMSPYGAALENSANENFNIDWQNQQLARQTQGLSAAQGAYGSAQGMGNSYTQNMAGLQAGQNEQYAGLTNAAQSQYSNYLNSMNQSNALNTQNTGASQQNAFGLGNQVAQSVYNGGQVGMNTGQQIYNNQNQAVQNFAGNNQSYLSGLNQLQSNDLGYMNFGQGAQNLGFNQNAYNNQQNQNAISQISGPVGKALSNTNWSNLFGSGNPTTSYNWNSGGNDGWTMSNGESIGT